MAKPLILGLGGTLREKSYSRMALEAALQALEAQGAETVMLDLRTLGLPMYDPNKPISDYQAAQVIQEFIDIHRQADGYIWSCPSYHGTVTGVFKNAVDFLEYLDDDEQPYLTGKAVSLIGVNDITPVETMRTIARELRAWVSPSTVVIRKTDFDSDGKIHNQQAIRRIERIASEALLFANRMKQG